jgi:hypothetical protein
VRTNTIISRMTKIEKARSARLKVKAKMAKKRDTLEEAINKWWIQIARNYGSSLEQYVFNEHCRSFLLKADDFIIQYCLNKFQLVQGSAGFSYLRGRALEAVKAIFRAWRDEVCRIHPNYGKPGPVPEFDRMTRMMSKGHRSQERY